jgi:hypothetical protein
MPHRLSALILLGIALGPSPAALAQTAATPCPYNYPAAHRPACVGDHTDRLLPIVYGRPASQTQRLAQQGKVVLRGCLISGCDPRYYCTIHKKDL